jgi:hypothetical protein
VVVGLLGGWWPAVVVGAVSAACLLLDLRIRLDLGKWAGHPAAEIGSRQVGASNVDVRGVEGARLLLDWTITSSLFSCFVASFFVKQLLVPLGQATLVITISLWSKLTLPKLTPEVSTLVALGIFSYFVALSWLVVRRLAVLLRFSSATRRLYSVLLFLPGINLLALVSLNDRAKEALRVGAVAQRDTRG